MVISPNGNQETVAVYAMWGFPDRLLVELPEHLQGKYHWFGVDSDGVSKLSGVGSFPYRNFNHDKAFGILLDPANFVKIEGDWCIERNGNSIVFSNSDIEVSVEKIND